jgi:hypothetical protein
MGFFGNLLGQGLGALGGELFGDAKTGSKIGGSLGNFLPFKKGGAVPGGRNTPVKALLHGGEYVLPAGVKPTKAQRAAVARGKKMK